MNLPDGLKHAASVAAGEVLIEWLEMIVADPAAVLEGDELGSTYQGYLSPDLLPEAEARRMLGELAAWDPGADDGSHAGAVARFEQAQLAAGIDVARALIALATGAGRVPDPVAPHAPALAPLVDLVKQAIADQSFDEDGVDLQELVWS